MTPEIIFQGFIVFLHDIFTALWVGGMLVLAFAALPAAREVMGKGETLMRFSAALKARLRRLAILSMAGLAVTGILLARRASGGSLRPLDFGSAYKVVLGLKHAAMAAMVVLALTRGFAKSGQKGLGAMKPQMILLAANIALAVVVLFASGLLSALPEPAAL